MSTSRQAVLGIVGATGAVGRTVLDVLPTRPDVWADIRLAAALEESGSVCRLGDHELPVVALGPEFFDGLDVVVMDLPEEVTGQWVEEATARGVVVVDNSTLYRMDPDVPLVVAEVNPQCAHERPKGVVANPSAVVLTMIDVLAVLHQEWELTELVVTALQAASGRGRAGMARLYDEIELVAGDRQLGQRPGDVRRLIEHELGPSPFPAPLALNLIPFVGHPIDGGWTSEEEKLRSETRKILDIPALSVSATCVRVPVVTTHSLSVHATFARQIKVEQVIRALMEAPMVVVTDDLDRLEFPTPSDIVGADPRFVGRIRQAIDFPRTLELFICGDNLRKGAALNMLQTAELIARDLPQPSSS